MEKQDMYIVVKREDVAKYLTKDEISLLESLLNTVDSNAKAIKRYDDRNIVNNLLGVIYSTVA